LESEIKFRFLRLNSRDHSLSSGIDKKYKIAHIILRKIFEIAKFIFNSKLTTCEMYFVFLTVNKKIFMEQSNNKINSSLRFNTNFEIKKIDSVIRIVKNK
jgi:hypothetical protein